MNKTKKQHRDTHSPPGESRRELQAELEEEIAMELLLNAARNFYKQIKENKTEETKEE